MAKYQLQQMILDSLASAYPRTLVDLAEHTEHPMNAVSYALEDMVNRGEVVHHGWDWNGYAAFWPRDAGMQQLNILYSLAEQTA